MWVEVVEVRTVAHDVSAVTVSGAVWILWVLLALAVPGPADT